MDFEIILVSNVKMSGPKSPGITVILARDLCRLLQMVAWFSIPISVLTM